jgi:signal transduction histidine kinase
MSYIAGPPAQNTKIKPAFRRQKLPRFSIGIKFVSLVMLVALLTGAVVGYILINTSRDSLRQQVLHNDLAQADLAAGFASNYMNAIQAHVQVFAQRPDVKQAIMSKTPEQIQSVLANFVAVQTALDSSGMYDIDGIQRAFYITNSATLGQSFADREWFQKTIAAEQPYLGTPIISRATGKPIVPYVVPVVDGEGQIRGLLAAAISLAILSDAIVNIDYGSNTQAMLVDKRNGGLIIAAKDPKLIMTPVPTGNEIKQRSLFGDRGVTETINGLGAQELIGFAPVPDLPWEIMIITPSKTALALINTLTRHAGLYTGLIIVLAAFAGIFLVVGITRPLRKLMLGTDEIGRGNLDYQMDIRSKDEIGDLAHAFSRMSQDLKQTLVSRNELAREVVERKKAEEELKAALTELKRSNEELQRFAYVASHDLQEPLRMVASFVQLLEKRYRDKLDQDANEFINFAVEGTRRMQNLINDLLTYSRVGSRVKAFQPVNLEEVLGIALNNLKVAVAESRAEVSHDPLPTVQADEGQITQVLQNLLSNAIKFRRDEPPRVHISAKQEKDEWIISVADTGIGIESQYFERIFVIFQRLHGQEYPGTGAGLSIAKRIVERHGGRIWIESQPGHGSTFYFSLPLKERNEHD